MSSDAELLQRSLAGQKDAFAGLVERYQNLVCAVTFGATGDRELAADLAQETFVAAWTSLPALRDESRFRSWLCGIARNLVGKVQRKPGRSADQVGHDLADPRPSAEDELESFQSQALLREILHEMDEASREPLVLYYWEGRSTKEVAARLGLSVSAVEQRLSRGRKQIKAEVEERVDRALRAARPDKRFSAMVLAAIDVAPAAAATNATSPARTSWTMAIAAALAVFGLLAWAFTRDDSSDGAGKNPAPHGGSALAASPVDDHGPPVSHEQASSPAPSVSAPELAPVATGAAANQPSEIADELMMESFPNRVVVNLLGGPSSMTAEQRKRLLEGSGLVRNVDGPVKDLPVRTIAGTVVDESGRPVPNAAVVAGSTVSLNRINGAKDQLTGQAGAMTDRKGAFSFEASTRPLMITAVAGARGFASPTSIAEGEESVSLELVIAGTATIEGDLTYEGEPVPGYAVLSAVSDSDDAELLSQHTTDAGGHFEASMLPPGKYRLFAQVNADGVAGWEGDQGPHAKTDVELQINETVRKDFDFTRGVTLEIRANRAANVAYYAFPGVELTQWSEASKLLSSPDSEASMVGSTPDDEEAFGVIQGLPAKPMTVCVVPRFKMFEKPKYTECKLVPAPEADDATVTVTFDLPAPS